ncbi:MAG: hypothetical protein AB1295_04530 [Candidatus Micrarchaeota archaeon]
MEEKEDEKDLIDRGICPFCKSKLIHTEGCLECERCGWSKCLEA